MNWRTVGGGAELGDEAHGVLEHGQQPRQPELRVDLHLRRGGKIR